MKTANSGAPSHASPMDRHFLVLPARLLALVASNSHCEANLEPVAIAHGTVPWDLRGWLLIQHSLHQDSQNFWTSDATSFYSQNVYCSARWQKSQLLTLGFVRTARARRAKRKMRTWKIVRIRCQMNYGKKLASKGRDQLSNIRSLNQMQWHTLQITVEFVDW